MPVYIVIPGLNKIEQLDLGHPDHANELETEPHCAYSKIHVLFYIKKVFDPKMYCLPNMHLTSSSSTSFTIFGWLNPGHFKKLKCILIGQQFSSMEYIERMDNTMLIEWISKMLYWAEISQYKRITRLFHLYEVLKWANLTYSDINQIRVCWGQWSGDMVGNGWLKRGIKELSGVKVMFYILIGGVTWAYTFFKIHQIIHEIIEKFK